MPIGHNPGRPKSASETERMPTHILDILDIQGQNLFCVTVAPVAPVTARCRITPCRCYYTLIGMEHHGSNQTCGQ